MSGLHRLAFEPKVQFFRAQGSSGLWTCAVCGEAMLESKLAKHRDQVHVVMVYPHGMPKTPPKERKTA